MKRLYFLTDNIESTENVSDDLHKAGITDWNFHVLSKKHESGLFQRHIHSANLLHKSDIIHSAERGAIIGFFIGVLCALLVGNVPVFGTTAEGIGVVAVILFGTLFGGWLGGFIGIQTENYKIKRFHEELENGKFLIMVDVDGSQESLVHEVISNRHPEVKYCVDGSTIITPFHQPKSINL